MTLPETRTTLAIVGALIGTAAMVVSTVSHIRREREKPASSRR